MRTSVEKVIKCGNRSIIVKITRKNVRNLSLRVKPDKVVYASVPYFASDAEINAFINKYIGFILKALDRIDKAIATAPLMINFADGDKVCVFGESKTLRVAAGNKNACALSSDDVLLTVRDANDVALRKKVFDKFARAATERLINSLCIDYYPKFAFKVKNFPVIKFRQMTSRWGSCTPDKNKMTFNYALFNAPVKCIEYVVVHEFSHFIEANHSKRFYAQVEKILPDYKLRRAALKKVRL